MRIGVGTWGQGHRDKDGDRDIRTWRQGRGDGNRDRKKDKDRDGDGDKDMETREYLLASVAGLALALCPLLAVALLHCPLCRRAQRWLRPLLLGLASGTLSGDALLHLLPQILGTHSHGGEVSQTPSEVSPTPTVLSPTPSEASLSSTEVSEEEQELPWTLLGVLVGLFVAFLMEKLLRILLLHSQGSSPSAPPVGHQHCHGELQQQPAGSSIELVKTEEVENPPTSSVLQSRGVPWTMTVGGAAHNLADGLALGASFAQSWRSGVSTGLALLCHGLPHAMGSVSVLSQSGLGPRRVLVLVCCWSLPVLLGLYLGLALGITGAASDWLAAIVTGLLLHLALADMVPAMVASEAGSPWVLLALQTLGLLGGWGGMVGLALAEGALPN
ncbi:zinc transporter ZIP4 [Melanerpes formicivorus]|uniref:zinc transporter ZIP4 n=1 Tax=Melanerpes formicivorus TaxID=211600 RepID=UPI00358EA1F3